MYSEQKKDGGGEANGVKQGAGRRSRDRKTGNYIFREFESFLDDNELEYDYERAHSEKKNHIILAKFLRQADLAKIFYDVPVPVKSHAKAALLQRLKSKQRRTKQSEDAVLKEHQGIRTTPCCCM